MRRLAAEAQELVTVQVAGDMADRVPRQGVYSNDLLRLLLSHFSNRSAPCSATLRKYCSSAVATPPLSSAWNNLAAPRVRLLVPYDR